MGDGAKRMGVDGKTCGEKVDSVLGSIGHHMDREDWLRLAWACVDQASGSGNVRLAQRAREAIEDMFDAMPETQREGTAPDPVKLSKDEERVLLSIREGTYVPPDNWLTPEKWIPHRLRDKGLVTFGHKLGIPRFSLTPTGEAVAQMAGAT